MATDINEEHEWLTFSYKFSLAIQYSFVGIFEILSLWADINEAVFLGDPKTINHCEYVVVVSNRGF